MKIKICVGESCHLQGAEEVVKTFQNNIDSTRLNVASRDNVQLMGCFCMNNCHQNRVSVAVDTVKHSIHRHDADSFFNTQLKTEE